MEVKKEEKSFSLGRLDVVDLYEWHTNNKLIYQTYFQRQFVWKEKDKKDLIDTIMKGYPIPAIFICDAKTNFTTLTKTYNVLDGRQRLESIFEFLDNKFDYNGKKFNEMSENEKKCILNYNITLVQMYLEPDNTEKIKEIFKRLNKNSYNLNRMEKQSTQLVEYDFMIIAKILSGIIQFENIESYVNEINELFGNENIDNGEIDDYDLEIDKGTDVPESIKEICKKDDISFINKLLTTDIVFKQYDRQRQIALQYFLNIFACIIKDEVINRNVSENIIIEISLMPKDKIQTKILSYNSACEVIYNLYQLDIDSFWKNKTSFFTLSIVFEKDIEYFLKENSESIKGKLMSFQSSDSDDWKKYYEASNQGVNDKKARELRLSLLKNILIGK